MNQQDPNQRIVIIILGIALLLGVSSLGATSFKGAPIDVAVVGIVMAITGAFTGYLNRPSTPPSPLPPGTVATTTTSTPPAAPPTVTVTPGEIPKTP